MCSVYIALKIYLKPLHNESSWSPGLILVGFFDSGIDKLVNNTIFCMCLQRLSTFQNLCRINKGLSTGNPASKCLLQILCISMLKLKKPSYYRDYPR